MNIISILLIEDEPDVVNFVKKGLGEESFEVSVALNGFDGLEMVLNNQYDIVLLDIMIPEKNGIEVYKKIRANGIQTPRRFLTALNTPDNIALGLNSGADDYLVKPFKFNELIARVNAILRRANIVITDRDGKFIHYKLNYEKLTEVSKFVADLVKK